jgi:outer membrane protein TolC
MAGGERSVLILAGLFLTLVPGHAMTQAAPDPLPQPLRLETALTAIDAGHPSLMRARARREQAEQTIEAERANGDVTFDAILDARWVEPNDNTPDDSNNDSRALLVARKLLSDFGHSGHRVAASQREAEIARIEEELAHARHRHAVMQHYFDVLLADLAFARDNEAMASAFVTLDRARNRSELGQVSDIELFELEAAYQTARAQRLRAQQNQRRSRAELGEALNRPGQAPAQVLGPSLPLNLPALPELGRLLDAIDRESPEVAIRRAQVEVAQRHAEAARTQHGPRLNAQAQFGWWNREFGAERNPAAVGLVLEIPIYQGRRSSSAIGEATAVRHLAEAELAQSMIEVRGAVRELYFEIEALLLQRDEAMARMDHRELYIDRARALYDMEEQADLGDSMVQQSAAAHFHAATEYTLALAFERLALLVGDPSLSVFSPDP